MAEREVLEATPGDLFVVADKDHPAYGKVIVTIKEKEGEDGYDTVWGVMAASYGDGGLVTLTIPKRQLAPYMRPHLPAWDRERALDELSKLIASINVRNAELIRASKREVPHG